MQGLLIRITDLIDGSPAKHDKFVYFSLLFAFLLNLALWITVVVAFWSSSEYIILQYNMYFGISSFGPWYQLLLMPLGGLAVILINGLLAFQIYLGYRVLARIMPVIAALINALLIIVVALLIYINS